MIDIPQFHLYTNMKSIQFFSVKALCGGGGEERRGTIKKKIQENKNDKNKAILLNKMPTCNVGQ